MPFMSNHSRIVYFDFMRSFCAIWIIGLWHMPNYMAPNIAAKFVNHFGWQTTFCVLATFAFISGFFGANNQIATRDDVLDYYKKRMLRIYPLYAIASITLVICQYNSWESLPLYLIGLGSFLKPYPATIWFVSMLLIFYFITPLLLKCSAKNAFVFSAIIEIIFLVLAFLVESDIRLAYYWPFYFLGLIFKRNNLNLKFFEGHRNWGCIVITFSSYFIIGMKSGNNFTIVTFICCLLFIYSVMNIFERLSKLVHFNRAISYISYSSMCAYLFHRPIFYIIKIIVGEFEPVVAFLIYLPCVFILGGVFQRTYDKLIFRNRSKACAF